MHRPTPSLRVPRSALLGAALACVALVGCDCEGDLDNLAPDIVVLPESIDLGLRSLSEGTEWAFVIGNDGNANLIIQEVRIDPVDEPAASSGGWVDTSGAAWTVLEQPAQVVPSGVEEGKVLFTPAAQGRFGGTLVIRSDDPDEPEVRVPLAGEGGTPLIEALPEALDFGVVNEGPGALRQVQLKNIGYDFLHISDIYLESAGPGSPGVASSPYSLDPELEVTRTLAVEQLISVDIRMDPTTAHWDAVQGGPLNDTLVVVSDAANESLLRIPITGDMNRAPAAIAVELVSRLTEVKVDIGREVIIDGSETEDPDGSEVTFSWSLVETPDPDAVLFPGVLGPECTQDSQCNQAMGYQCVAGSSSSRCRQVEWTHLIPGLPGTYVVRLRATDELGAWSEAEVRILPRDFALVLTWEPQPGSVCTTFTDAECDAIPNPEDRFCPCDQSDLDLHFLRPASIAPPPPPDPDGGVADDGGVSDGGTPPPDEMTDGFCSLGSCPAGCLEAGPPVVNYCVESTDEHQATCRSYGADCSTFNRYPEWGQPGRLDDPRLDVDDVRGKGPEIVTLDNPADGTYTAVVHYYLDVIGAEPSLASLDVYVRGELVQTIGPQLLEEGDVWYAATMTRSGGPGENGQWDVSPLPPVVLPLGTDVCGY